MTALWAAYLLALPFHRMWMAPWLGRKFQPPEIVLVALIVASAIMWARGRVRWQWTLADAVPATWLAANLLSYAWSREPHTRAGLIETLGAASVVALYVAVRATATPRLLDRFGEWFGYAAATAALLGISGSLAAYAGWPNRLANVTPFPYLGHAPRAHAFTAGPQMLASILLMAIPLYVASRMAHGWRNRDRVLIFVLVVGLGATFSKTAMCLVAALGVMWLVGSQAGQRAPSSRPLARAWTAAVISLIVAFAFTMSSHVMVLRETAVPGMSAVQFVSGRPLASLQWRNDAWVLMPTIYVFNNQASIEAIRHSWPIGVGPAGQPAFTMKLQREGRLSTSVFIITPHSTYLGSVAQLGALGLATLLVLLFAGIVTIRRLRTDPRLRWESAAYAGAGAAFLIEAISTDLLNCRHYWLLLAVMAARLESVRPRLSTLGQIARGGG